MPEPAIRVRLVRGRHPTVWGLRPFEHLPDRFDARLLVPQRLDHDLAGLALPTVPARTLRDRLPAGRVGNAAALALRDRFLDGTAAFGGCDIVHAEELSFWFTAQAAREKARLGFRLVVTVWETLPYLDAFRLPPARRHRRDVLAAADLYLAATERARDGLLLEGVAPDRVHVAYPGIDLDRFAAPAEAPREPGHVLISPGRLEWEKGHHDVLRAVAALRRGLVPLPDGVADGLRLVLVGAGPERERLEAHAQELGIGHAVTFTRVPYDEMPALYAGASGMVLASLPSSGCTLYPGDVPRCFWEEQFGLVIAEAMAAGLPLALSTSGAIPEVAGDGAAYFPPGDYMGLARALADGPLRRPPGERVRHDPERVRRYSIGAAAERIADAYDAVVASR